MRRRRFGVNRRRRRGKRLRGYHGSRGGVRL